MARKPRPNPKPNDAGIAAGVLAIVGGGDDQRAIGDIIRSGTPQDDASLVLAEAKRRIQITADYHRDEQLGLAIRRLNRLIERNLEDIDGDDAIVLRSQVELNKLLRLHDVRSGADGPAEGESRTDDLAEVRGHLAPLFPALPADYPVNELARMAAETVRTAHGRENPTD